MTQTLTFDGGLLARGWLATHIPTGADEELPILCGTLLIETYGDGVRLTATDRYVLLTSWISDQGRDPDKERALDEAPDDSIVVRDPDGRGKALLTYLRKLAAKAAKDDMPPPVVALHLRAPAEEGVESGFPGMELEQVVIDYPDHEKLALPIVQGVFPSYRTIILGHEPGEATEFGISPDAAARLGQVGKMAGGFLRCTLSGPRSGIAVEFFGAPQPPSVRGVVMPVVTAEDEA